VAITANNSGSNRRDRLYGRMYTPAANIFSSSITIPSEVILYIHNHNYTRNELNWVGDLRSPTQRVVVTAKIVLLLYCTTDCTLKQFPLLRLVGRVKEWSHWRKRVGVKDMCYYINCLHNDFRVQVRANRLSFAICCS
jgi:hypothetical protein